LTFERESRLRRIGPKAFSGCTQLKSILLPSSIQDQSREWSLESSLEAVTFEPTGLGRVVKSCAVY
jgi:hypothetical protein